MKRLRKFKRNIFDKDKLTAWAKAVKKKDGYQCVACGYTGYLHSHHILPKSKYPKYAYCIWNGVTLCKICHLGSSGVHKKRPPRNLVVKQLRKLLTATDKETVKSFQSSLKPAKKVSKVYKPYKRFKKLKKRKK